MSRRAKAALVGWLIVAFATGFVCGIAGTLMWAIAQPTFGDVNDQIPPGPHS